MHCSLSRVVRGLCRAHVLRPEQGASHAGCVRALNDCFGVTHQASSQQRYSRDGLELHDGDAAAYWSGGMQSVRKQQDVHIVKRRSASAAAVASAEGSASVPLEASALRASILTTVFKPAQSLWHCLCITAALNVRLATRGGGRLLFGSASDRPR